MISFPGISQTKYKKSSTKPPTTSTSTRPQSSATNKNTMTTTKPNGEPPASTQQKSTSTGRRAQSIEYADDPALPLANTQVAPISSRSARKKRVHPHQASPEHDERSPTPGPPPAKKIRSSFSPPSLPDSPPPDTPPRSSTPVNADGMSLEAWLAMIHLLDGKHTKAMRIELNYESVYQACRSMVRKMGHFARFERVIRTGLRYINTPFAEQPWAKSSKYDTPMEDKTMWDVLIADFPGFETHIAHLHGDHEGVRLLGRFLTAILSKTRSDDILRMEYNTNFLRACKIPNPKYKLSEKQYRGYKNTTMARRLIPPGWIDEFDVDPHSMTQKLKDGAIAPLAADLPSFLWDLSQYNQEDTITGLLYSDDVRTGYKLLYTGPDSAIDNYNKTGKGQPSLARKYGLTTVTIHSIVYVALLVRHAWSSQPAWKDTDGSFSYPTMARLLLSACMRNPQYISKLVADYTNDTYGTAGRYGEIDPEDDPASTFGRLMQGPNELEDAPGAYFQYALNYSNDHGSDHDADGEQKPDGPGEGSEIQLVPGAEGQADALGVEIDPRTVIRGDAIDVATNQ